MIGLFNDCFPPIMDGVSVTVSNYARWLPRYGWNVSVITPKVPSADYSDLPYEVYPYYSFPMPRRNPYRLGFPQLDFSFANKIHKVPFSLLHAHCPFSSGQIALRIAKKRHIPFIATFHSKYRMDIERYISNKYVVDAMVKHIIDFYEEADEVWIPQLSVGETLRSYGYKGAFEVMDNGNDLSTPYSPDIKDRCKAKLGISSSTPMLLFVGQHILEKNVLFLIDAINQIKNLDFHLYFVGDGYAANTMVGKVLQYGLQDKVTFVGQIIDRKKLNEYYMASDLFVFPSLYDNAPLVVREAAAMHTPSLLINGSTAAEIINDKINGFLAENNANAYAGQIKSIILNPKMMQRVGDSASDSIVQRWRDVVGEVDDRYNHLIRRYNGEISHVSPRDLVFSS